MNHKTLNRVSNIIIVLATINIWLFMIFGSQVSGSAVSGKVEDGRYYVRLKSFPYEEVAYPVYLYKYVHEVFTFFLSVLTVLAILYKTQRQKDKLHARSRQQPGGHFVYPYLMKKKLSRRERSKRAAR
jgi:hypothetical protein